MPNLTYLLTFDDMAARERSWATFRTDPEWKALWATPGLTDAEIVSNVTSVLLRPAPYSRDLGATSRARGTQAAVRRPKGQRASSSFDRRVNAR